MANSLHKVPITEDTLRAVRFAFTDRLNGRDFDESLILAKNRQYGDAWQAEGPFLAASRMKDKIARVVTVIEHYRMRDGSGPSQRTSVSLTNSAEGFQDILEMIAYGHLLILYWADNDLGLAGTEEEITKRIYEYIKLEMTILREEGKIGDAAGRELEQGQGEDSSGDQEVHPEE